MARVFTGKIVIPGDRIEEYLHALEEAEKEVEPFRNFMLLLKEEFEQHLSSQVSARTVRKHCAIIDVFIDFLCLNTDVRRIEDISRGIANSYFRRWYMGKIGDCSESELKAAIKKFFQYLASEKGIRNEEVLKSFKM
jgi:site-specific recombinase XerD